MILKPGMDQDQFDDFVSKIDTKHETVLPSEIWATI